jgi:hypothetical protein
MAVTPAWGAVFVAYGGTLKLLGRDDLRAVAMAGATCGLAYTIVVCPFELVKVNAQKAQLSTTQAFRQLYSQLGVRGMYRGFRACALRDCTQSTAYYTCAESLNSSRMLRDQFGESAPIVAGAITGVVHCTIEFPSDVVKARMQTNLNLTYKQCLLELCDRTELKRVSVALVPTLVRAIFVHSAAFFAVRCAVFDRNLPLRMPLDPTHVRLKRTCV